MGKKSVVLIYPHFRTSSENELLFLPLGISSLASQIKALGIEVKCVDCTFLNLEEAVFKVAEADPAIVGLYTMITMTKNTFKILDALKNKLPEALFVSGGPLPSLYPKTFSEKFHIVFRGESDISFPNFCRDFINGNLSKNKLFKLDLKKYDGIYIDNGTIIDVPPIHLPEEVIKTLSLPDRSEYSHKLYQKFSESKTGYKTTSLLTTRGCPFNCDFCSRPIFGNYFRKRNLESVMEEILEIQKLGYNDLWIADDSFTLDEDYLRSFCEQLYSNNFNLSWTCLSRANGVTDKMVFWMKRSGCRKVYLGLESGSEETLHLMQKHLTIADGKKAAQLFNDAGIKVSAFFIVGYPGEKPESIEKTFEYALSLPLDEVSFNVPFPLPGSSLYSRIKGLDTQADWDMENEIKFVYDSEFDENYLKDRISSIMEEFKNRTFKNIC